MFLALTKSSNHQPGLVGRWVNAHASTFGRWMTPQFLSLSCPFLDTEHHHDSHTRRTTDSLLSFTFPTEKHRPPPPRAPRLPLQPRRSRPARTHPKRTDFPRHPRRRNHEQLLQRPQCALCQKRRQSRQGSSSCGTSLSEFRLSPLPTLLSFLPLPVLVRPQPIYATPHLHTKVYACKVIFSYAEAYPQNENA